jgi:hypothetical protein
LKELESVYHARLAKEAKDFLRGRTPGEDDQEYKHCAMMRVALGLVYRKHAASANADASSNVRLHPHKPGGIDPPDNKPEHPEDPPATHNFRSCSTPARATLRVSSCFRDNSEVWQHWWDCCQQYIVNKINAKVGMTSLMGAPLEHLCNVKLSVATTLYDSKNNLLVFNTWLNKVPLYKLTGPARDQTCANTILGLLTGSAHLWYHTIGDPPDQPHSFKEWILALHARFFITCQAALTAMNKFNLFEYTPEMGVL